MAFVITDACVGVKDGACVDVCPVDAIHPTRSEAGYDAAAQLYIDPQACICCGLCVGECPAGAIFAEEDLAPEKRVYVTINAQWFKKGA